MENLRQRGGNFVGGATDSINRFARAVRYPTDGGNYEDYVPPAPPEED
jgi:hypothetical protein